LNVANTRIVYHFIAFVTRLFGAPTPNILSDKTGTLVSKFDVLAFNTSQWLITSYIGY